MTDAGGELKGAFTQDARVQHAHVEDLLTAAVQFSGACKAYLLVQKGENLVVDTKIVIEGDKAVATHPQSASLAPGEAALLELIASNSISERYTTLTVGDPLRAPRPADNAEPALCLQVGGEDGASWVVYMESDPRGAGFPGHIVSAIELYALALGRVLKPRCRESKQYGDTSHLMDRTPSDRRTEIDGVDRAIIAGVAESIAIEINDALSAVVAHASAGLQWLNQEAPKVEKARQSLRKIASSTFAIGSVVAAYRKTSPAGGPDSKPLDLQAIVIEALEAIAPDLQDASVQSYCDIPREMLVRGNAKQIQQAIVNVVSIAFDAMKAVDTPRKLTISNATQDKFFVLAFSDTGETIPVGARDAIFDLSYTAKQGHRGVKLAIARTIAQLHGGSLDVARSETDGTTMLLRLPMATTG